MILYEIVSVLESPTAEPNIKGITEDMAMRLEKLGDLRVTRVREVPRAMPRQILIDDRRGM
jgi:hypothetical protein